MSTLTSTAPQLASPQHPTVTDRFVVATDGRPQSDAALIMGRLLGNEHREVRLVTVLDTVNLVPESEMMFSEELMTERMFALQREIEAQTARVWGRGELPDVWDGDPARCITQLARNTNATLIIAGIGRHNVTDRLFSDETALRLMRMSDTPVLAVANTARHVPRCIVAAIDFSDTSERAAQTAVSLAAPGSTLHLVHVAPRDGDLFTWATSHKQHVASELDRVQARIKVPADMQVKTMLLQGEPAAELLSFAKSISADLIATGSHGHGFIARLLVGSVATRLVRGARCSVLVVPQATAAASAHVTRPAVPLRAVAREQWQSLLNDLTRRNLGRIATLEINDPLMGAQVQQINHAFMGATWDKSDSSIQLLFGGSESGAAHLTRDIARVTAVHVLQNQQGQDVALCVGHGMGQTVVTFR